MNLKIAIRLTLLTSISPFVFADVPQTQAPVFPKAAPENSASGPDAQKLPEKITILGHELNLKEQKGDPNGQCIAEYIEADKTWENWTWMFSVRVFPAVSPAATAEFYAKAVVIGMQKRKATDPVSNAQSFTYPFDKSAAVDFCMSDGKDVVEHNVQRFFKVGDNIIQYQIARRLYLSKTDTASAQNFMKQIATLRGSLLTELRRDDLPLRPAKNPGEIRKLAEMKRAYDEFEKSRQADLARAQADLNSGKITAVEFSAKIGEIMNRKMSMPANLANKSPTP